MRKYNLIVNTILIAICMLIFANTATAQYWFQTGVRGSNDASFNNGAGITIQTVYQNATDGSMGFWVGEDISNGAFIQVGYEITNATGYYSSACMNSTKSVYLKAGVPTWFWEYFSAGAGNNQSFCGGIGPNGSAGINGSFNTYSFKASGNTWYAYVNGEEIGHVNLGTSSSGANPPSAFAEYADTSTNKHPLENVTFKELLYYIGNESRLVPEGYSSISYGVGSLTALSNPYGIQEVGNYTNYFVVGSAVPQPKRSIVLWRVGYGLSLYSEYGNVSGSGNYIAYSVVPISAPQLVNISNGTREQFSGWKGVGYGSYTGPQTLRYITLYANVTETATWKRQYYINATTEYGAVYGSGWYDANSTATLAVNSNIIVTGPGSRVVFEGWSNNYTTNSITLRINGPESIHPIWEHQYYVNVTSEYGNASGSGWYDANSTANITVATTNVPINSTTRLAFKSWSNGNENSSIGVVVDSPVFLKAVFRNQYLIILVPMNSYGQNLSGVSYYNVSSRLSNGSIFVFPNTTYNIEYMHYKGVTVTIDHSFSVSTPETVYFKTPIYDIEVYAKSVFGTPVNASLNITFRNNTNIVTHVGKNGSVDFHNVPYGYVTGYAEYLGLKQSVNLQYGVNSYLTFFTTSLMALIIGGILFVVVIAKVVSYYETRRTVRKTKRTYRK